MKTKYLIFSLATLLVLYSCTKDEEVAITTVQINNLSITPQYTHSAFACDLVANSPIANVALQYSTDPAFGEGLYQTLQLNQNEHHYTASLEPLQQGQTYYVRYKVHNSFNSMIPAQVDTFRTRAYTLPSVRTDSVTHITTHSADCYFTLTDWGCDSLPSVGVYCRTLLSDSTNFPYITQLTDSTYICTLSNLTEGTTYSVYAYAKNAQGIAYSEKIIEFITLFSVVLPTVVTSDVTTVSYTCAVCGGNITSDGHTEIIERGICYSTEAQPTIQDYVIQSGKGAGIFSCELSSLKESTTYYVRAFATNSKGTAYGEQKTFITPNRGETFFSIATDKYCLFSKGNLQYQVSTDTWSFAEHQYDMIGAANVSDGVWADKIDLFGWSVNNWNSLFGVSTSNLYSGNFLDWGSNQINNDAPHTWRTLTSEEWTYLFQHTRWTMARVNNILGFMLFPNGFTAPAGLTVAIIGGGNMSSNSISFSESDYASNQYTTDVFAQLETLGCIFLPCAGNGDRSTVYSVGRWGSYWSASSKPNTYNNNGPANFLFFNSRSAASSNQKDRIYRSSVRLVCDIQ